MRKRLLLPVFRLLLACSLLAAWNGFRSAFADDAPPEGDPELYNATHQRDPDFQKLRPAWAFELDATLSGLDGAALFSSMAGYTTSGATLECEYQFPFLQFLGVISAGPSFGFYPVPSALSVTSGSFSVWEMGFQARYQARFFHEQILVPFVGYSMEFLNYSFLTPALSGHIPLRGPSFGGQLLLNALEPSFATQGYLDNGILRSYIVAEIRALSGSDTNVSISGNSFFFGLRIEY